eukprot:6482735-Amphidinium_carterae.1
MSDSQRTACQGATRADCSRPTVECKHKGGNSRGLTFLVLNEALRPERGGWDFARLDARRVHSEHVSRHCAVTNGMEC